MAQCTSTTIRPTTPSSPPIRLDEPMSIYRRQFLYKDKKLIGNKAKNQHVQIAGQFCKWLVKPKHLLPFNPLEDVQLLRAADNSGYRRAASMEEINKLLATCPTERRLFYLFLLYVPLR